MNIFEAAAGTPYVGRIDDDWGEEAFIFMGLTRAVAGYILFSVISQRGVEELVYGDEADDDLDWVPL